MKPFYRLQNPIRDYAWGHERHIPEFLGVDYPPGKPAAEMWMGAHPSAPSVIVDGDAGSVGLDEWIANRPDEILGEAVARRYGRLPFLYKLLAAGKSLSIQAHPDKATAERGFERENREGIPVDAPQRNYRDDNHKPEIIMAITPFTAMIGFRKPEEIGRIFGRLSKDSGTPVFSKGVVEGLENGNESLLSDFLTSLLGSAESERQPLIRRAVDRASQSADEWGDLPARWLPRLAEQFPGDAGVLAPLFLNVVEIQPGEALYQPARVLHAYLAGFGLELMANSDNVLRGGLTPKNVDVPELERILDFHASDPAILTAQEDAGGMLAFLTPAEEFRLRLVDVATDRGGASARLESGRGPLIALVIEGAVSLDSSGDSMALSRGESVFVPWGAPSIALGGTGRIAIAEVGA